MLSANGQAIRRRTFLKNAATLAFSQALPAPRPAVHRFSLAHLTVLGCAPPEATRIAARAGYDFVSLRTIFMGLPNEPNYDLAHNPLMLRETRAALAATGLKLHDIELARIADSVDVKSYAPALETAADLGARRVIASVWTARRNFAADSLGHLCDLAAKSGLDVSLEFVTWANLTNLRDAAGMCREVNRANLGLLIDVLHVNRSRILLNELESVPREWFHFAHISDAPREIPATTEGLIHTGREARLYPGEGAIDIAAIVNRMPEVPYSLEIPNLERVKELGFAEHARRCLESAKKYFAAHPRVSTGAPQYRYR
jgi:sugar phosphate isomerase/epimerase